MKEDMCDSGEMMNWRGEDNTASVHLKAPRNMRPSVV